MATGGEWVKDGEKGEGAKDGEKRERKSPAPKPSKKDSKKGWVLELLSGKPSEAEQKQVEREKKRLGLELKTSRAGAWTLLGKAEKKTGGGVAEAAAGPAAGSAEGTRRAGPGQPEPPSSKPRSSLDSVRRARAEEQEEGMSLSMSLSTAASVARSPGGGTEGGREGRRAGGGGARTTDKAQLRAQAEMAARVLAQAPAQPTALNHHMDWNHRAPLEELGRREAEFSMEIVRVNTAINLAMVQRAESDPMPGRLRHTPSKPNALVGMVRKLSRHKPPKVHLAPTASRSDQHLDMDGRTSSHHTSRPPTKTAPNSPASLAPIPPSS